jgi:hypothetical protein
MISQIMVTEMVAAVERERMVEMARSHRLTRMPNSGRNGSRMERARNLVSAFLGRAGRSLDGDAAPASAKAPLSAVAAPRGTIG